MYLVDMIEDETLSDLKKNLSENPGRVPSFEEVQGTTPKPQKILYKTSEKSKSMFSLYRKNEVVAELPCADDKTVKDFKAYLEEHNQSPEVTIEIRFQKTESNAKKIDRMSNCFNHVSFKELKEKKIEDVDNVTMGDCIRAFTKREQLDTANMW